MRDDEDTQALHYAIEARCEKSVQILLQHGARVNDACRKKTTGEHLVIQ